MSPNINIAPLQANEIAAAGRHWTRNKLKCLLGVAYVLVTAAPLRAESLHDALLQAYQANPTLNAQRKSVLAIAEDLNRARAGYLPKVSASADIGYYKE